MIIIKGDLIVKLEREPLPTLNHLIQTRKRTSSNFESFDSNSKEINIVCFADLHDYNTTGAIVFDGVVEVSEVDTDQLVLVTGEVLYE